MVTLHNDGGERLWYWTGKSTDLGGSVTGYTTAMIRGGTLPFVYRQ